MRTRPPALASVLLALTVALAGARPAAAQADAHAGHGMEAGLLADLMEDVAQVEQKLTALARAMPAEAWTWRPGEGVRSTREVFLHVASDNYFLPTALGTPAPAETGIRGDDFGSPVAYEKRALGQDEAVAALRASFLHLNQVLQDEDEAALGGEISMFGSPSTRRKLWLLTAVHLHEHLGQLIAYARVNGVTPPWSR